MQPDIFNKYEMKRFLKLLLVILIVGFVIYSLKSKGKKEELAEDQIMNETINMNNSEKSKSAKMTYRIEGGLMPYKYIYTELEEPGKVHLDYETYASFLGKPQKKVSFVRNYDVKAEVFSEILELYKQLNYLEIEVDDLNKNKMQAMDVGTTSLSYKDSRRDNKLSYGYVEDNKVLDKISEKFQEITKKYLLPEED